MFVLLFSIFSLSNSASAQYCYWPNGNLATDDIPCNPTADVSFCCGAGDACSTNQVCIDEYGTHMRGSCTDINWASDKCPKFCLTGIANGVNASHADLASYDVLTYCGSSSQSAALGQFEACCGDPGNYYHCDCASDPVITLAAISTFATVLPSSTGASLSGGSSTSAKTTGSPAPSSSASSAQSLSQSSGVGSISTPTTSSTSSSSSTFSKGAMAGIAVGAIVAALVILALIFALLHMRRRLRNLEAQINSSMQPAPTTASMTGRSQPKWPPSHSELSSSLPPEELAAKPVIGSLREFPGSMPPSTATTYPPAELGGGQALKYE